MPSKWRLLDPPPMTAAEQMALDEVLLEVRGQGRSTDTLRFLQFHPPAVLVGYHQSIHDEVRLDVCRELGIDVNRRITGGGGLLFDENQIGWEIVCDKAFFGMGIPNADLFRKLCDPVVTALREMGLPAAFRPRNDIEISGRKISGTGGTDSDDAFMFQGTLLVDFDVETMLSCLRVPAEKMKGKEADSLRRRVTCLAWEIGAAPDPRNVKEHLARAFARHMGVELVPGTLTEEERELLQRRLPHFRSMDWIDMVRSARGRTGTVRGVRKAPGGLVRTTLQLDLPAGIVTDAFITGDFLAFPARGLLDLEAALRGRPADPDELCAIVGEHFHDGRIAIPEMGAEDICIPLRLALERGRISSFGIPLDMCDHITTINGSFGDVLHAGPGVLILPYCAHDVDCEDPFGRECMNCGKCGTSEAWNAGHEAGIEVVRIAGAGPLVEELARARKAGIRAFIGCCCPPFLVRHEEIFVRSRLPGIILDIAEGPTCHDLNQGEEGRLGTYEGVTSLDLPLLRTVLEVVQRAS
ncbi:MAG: lipoate--protein ligase family protein [Desulfovibrio sp.]|jgi:lipoate-protein ligase A|nr:lipoate--protein ligase family protein [Desulfovibrio sp.]